MMTLSPVLPVEPRARTDALLKETLLQYPQVLGQLTEVEEVRLKDFITKGMPRPHVVALEKIKSPSVRHALGRQRTGRMLYRPFTKEARFAKAREEGEAAYLSQEDLERYPREVARLMVECDQAYFSLSKTFGTIREAQTYFDLTKDLTPIPGAFQTERMCIEAVQRHPLYFKFVTRPTMAVMRALFPDEGGAALVAERIKWIPRDFDFATVDPGLPAFDADLDRVWLKHIATLHQKMDAVLDTAEEQMIRRMLGKIQNVDREAIIEKLLPDLQTALKMARRAEKKRRPRVCYSKGFGGSRNDDGVRTLPKGDIFSLCAKK